MLLRLILMRHGEAGPAQAGDKMRPLTSRGRRQAAATARAMAAFSWKPDAGISSTALRASETMEVVASAWEPSFPWQLDDTLYLATYHSLEAALTDPTFATAKCVLAIGHNPGWSHAVAHWTGVTLGLDVAEAALMSVEADSWTEACALVGLWELEHVITNVV